MKARDICSCCLGLAIILCLLIPVVACSSCNQFVPSVVGNDTVSEAWVANYDGDTADDDGGQALAIDGAGNVYVTGYSWGESSSSDYATIKYGSGGDQLWVARYDGPAHGEDWPLALVLDSVGNLYVTGWSQGNGTVVDYATVKYDGDGNVVWVARYDGQVSGHDVANDVAVDYWDNVYVTGWSQGNGSDVDYVAVKYDGQGNELWVARYNGPAGEADRAYAVAVDAWGNVYVTGSSQGESMRQSYATVKYDSDGNQLWVGRYDGLEGDNCASAVAVDGWGNVFVTGWSQGSGIRYDYATVKYDSGGNQLWAMRYDGPAGGDDIPNDMVLDNRGDVYVTGQSVGNGTEADYATVKYGTDGTLLWQARYDGPVSGEDNAETICLDSWGSAYVGGWSQGDKIRYDFATVKYNADGDLLWAARYDGAANGHDKVYSIAVDGSGNSYVTGRSSGKTTYYDYTTIKYTK